MAVMLQELDVRLEQALLTDLVQVCACCESPSQRGLCRSLDPFH